MKRGSLVVINIGLVIIMFSAAGADMEINYYSLTIGLFFAAVGLFMFLCAKKNDKKER